MPQKLRPRVMVAACTTAFVAVFVLSSGLFADHQWGTYHWARSSNPFELKIGYNVDNVWSSHLTQAIADWDTPLGGYPDVLTLTAVAGGTDPVTCAATFGQVEVCNGDYGQTGWLGVAQIWISTNSHIVAGTTRVNDYYFSPDYRNGFYDTSAWRQFVICQEIGHDWGLDHQDTNFNNPNLGSCMDYTDDPDGSKQDPLSNEHPNVHDFEELAIIYTSHFDGGGGGGGGGRGRGHRGAGPADLPAVALEHVPDLQTNFGQLVRLNGRFALYERDLGNGIRVFTFVIQA